MKTFYSFLLALSAFWLLPVAVAQFNFFEQMFGHGQQQQQRGSGVSQWASQADAVSCTEYLCPTTLVCVNDPADCPCPSVEDEKCLIPDNNEKGSATVICARGSGGCTEVLHLLNKWK